MGGCHSFGGGGVDDGVATPVQARGPAELLNLGRDAEIYFARGGRVWYEEVSLFFLSSSTTFFFRIKIYVFVEGFKFFFLIVFWPKVIPDLNMSLYLCVCVSCLARTSLPQPYTLTNPPIQSLTHPPKNPRLRRRLETTPDRWMKNTTSRFAQAMAWCWRDCSIYLRPRRRSTAAARVNTRTKAAAATTTAASTPAWLSFYAIRILTSAAA